MEREDFETRLAEGRDRCDRGDYEGALEIFQALAKEAPDNAEVWYWCGLAYFRLEQYDDCIKHCNLALEIKPEYPLALARRGMAYKELEQEEKAKIDFEQAILIEPQNHEDWRGKGIALDELERYEEAIASLDKAIEIKSDYYLNWNNRGIILENSKRHREAIASFDKAIEIKPDYYLNWNNRGNSLNSLKRYEEAIASFDKAIEIKPDHYISWHNRGSLLNNLKRYEEAIASYDKSMKIKPDYYFAWYNRGNSLYFLERYEEAIASYDKAIRIKPNYYFAWSHKGNLLYFLERYEEAIASFDKAIEIEPSDNTTWRNWHIAVRNQSDPFSYWLKAQDFCDRTLDTLSFTEFPEKYIAILRQLLKLCNYLGDKHTSQQRLEQGTQLLEKLLGDPDNTENQQKIDLARKFAPFFQLQVDRKANSNNPQDIIEALDIAEERKNTCLHWLQTGWVYKFPQKTSYADIQKLLKPRTAIVYWHISPLAITTFILKKDTNPIVFSDGQPQNPQQGYRFALESSSVTSNPSASEQVYNFEQWLKDWQNAYHNYNPHDLKTQDERQSKSWIQDMESRLDNLRNILNIDRIFDSLQKIDRVILIPHRQLHLLPLHQFFRHLTVTHLPSARIGLYLKQILGNHNNSNRQNTPDSSSLLNVEQANELPFAFLEAATLNLFFPNNQTYRGEKVTRAKIVDAVAKNQGIFHFTGHAYHNSDKPLESALILANEQELTLKDIFRDETLQLSNYFLICLSACETGITSQQNLIDEYVGLVSGFLKMGANYVLSTLWTVEERATGLLLSQFYHRYQQSRDPAIALKQSQNWLKRATHQDIAKWYNDLAEKFLKSDRLNKLQRFLLREAKREADLAKIEESAHPYANPYYWAAFIITGIH
ncbi:MAG: tetratricopeptide repeat protein [Cyanobacteria bacterium P01_E01_bin.42]